MLRCGVVWKSETGKRVQKVWISFYRLDKCVRHLSRGVDINVGVPVPPVNLKRVLCLFRALHAVTSDENPGIFAHTVLEKQIKDKKRREKRNTCYVYVVEC